MTWYMILLVAGAAVAVFAVIRIVHQNNQRRSAGSIVAPGDHSDAGHHGHDGGGHDGGGGGPH